MACITKRRGKYVIDCYDQNGKRYRKTLPKGINREERRKALREIEEKIEQRSFIHDSKIPLFSEIKSQWLEYKKQFLRETTWETYSTNAKNHFNDLDPLKITRITTVTIEKFIGNRQKQGMNINTLRKIIVGLNQIMAYAVRHRIISFNPVHDAERPRRKGKEGEEKSIVILKPKQIRTLLDSVKDQKYKTLFLTAIMTGARQGEVLGLKWSDVDFQKKQVCINRTFNMGRFFTPKTKGSIRRIDLAPIVVKDLLAWKLKSGGRKDDLVFPSESGGPMNSCNMVSRHFRPALKKAEIERIRFHDLRHTYASLLIHQGENIKYIQTQLGHSSPSVTLNVYAHLMKDQNQEAACRLENAIFKATGHNLVTEENKELTVNG
jgi:integrase